MGEFGSVHAADTFPGAETYRRITQGELIPLDAEGLDQLLAVGLVEPVADRTGMYRAVNVRQAQEEMIARARSDLAGLALMASIVNPPAQGNLGTAPEHLSGLDVINSRLEQEVAGAQSEILSSHPHVLHRKRQHRAHQRDIAALERGVTMRTLYPAAACGRSSTRDWVREMSALGGEYRVLHQPFTRGIVIDRKVAFIDDLEPSGAEASERCVVVRDPAVAAFLAKVFNAAWERALGWSFRSGSKTMTTHTQRAILRELINDRTQEGAAKALNMSSRAVEKHLATLRDALGVHSTYAALAWWLRSDETELD